MVGDISPETCREHI